MKVWILIGGWHHEGEDADSLRVLGYEPSEDEKDKFKKGYNYIECKEIEVESNKH